MWESSCNNTTDSTHALFLDILGKTPTIVGFKIFFLKKKNHIEKAATRNAKHNAHGCNIYKKHVDGDPLSSK